jgi:hypothetical protein
VQHGGVGRDFRTTDRADLDTDYIALFEDYFKSAKGADARRQEACPVSHFAKNPVTTNFTNPLNNLAKNAFFAML